MPPESITITEEKCSERSQATVKLSSSPSPTTLSPIMLHVWRNRTSTQDGRIYGPPLWGFSFDGSPSRVADGGPYQFECGSFSGTCMIRQLEGGGLKAEGIGDLLGYSWQEDHGTQDLCNALRRL
jgi:hypothetical protein